MNPNNKKKIEKLDASIIALELQQCHKSLQLIQKHALDHDNFETVGMIDACLLIIEDLMSL